MCTGVCMCMCVCVCVYVCVYVHVQSNIHGRSVQLLPAWLSRIYASPYCAQPRYATVIQGVSDRFESVRFLTSAHSRNFEIIINARRLDRKGIAGAKIDCHFPHFERLASRNIWLLLGSTTRCVANTHTRVARRRCVRRKFPMKNDASATASGQQWSRRLSKRRANYSLRVMPCLNYSQFPGDIRGRLLFICAGARSHKYRLPGI